MNQNQANPESTRTVEREGRAFSVHELKCWPVHYSAIADRMKHFELRRNDRGFRKGDRLWLREWSPVEGGYTGNSLDVAVTHVVESHEGLAPGFVLMAIMVL